MARILVIILITVHGLIHLMGFVKGVGLAEIEELTLPVSGTMAVVWLLAALLFLTAALLYALRNEWWWLVAILAVVVSQILVITYWQDAWAGTIPNLIILVVAGAAWAIFSFDRMVSREVHHMFSENVTGTPDTITEDMLTGLPEPVRHWLQNSGIVGRERIYAVRLKQKLRLRMRPDTERWTPARAVQYFTVDEPAFIWHVNMQMLPLVTVVGRDTFRDGRGEMLIKIAALFPVVDSKGNERIDTGSLQRYLGEMVWFPSAALSPYITWETIDAHAVRATLSYGGTTDSGIFQFNEEGGLIRFRARRFQGDAPDAERKEWVIDVLETREMDGIRVPTNMKATWKLDEGDWTWLHLELTDIEYNTPSHY